MSIEYEHANWVQLGRDTHLNHVIFFLKKSNDMSFSLVGASRARPVARGPRRQQPPPGGPARLRGCRAAPRADGARRRGREGRLLRIHCAAHGGSLRPRGDLPGAAGGGGPGGRQGHQRPLGHEEMETVLKKNRTQHVTCKT